MRLAPFAPIGGAPPGSTHDGARRWGGHRGAAQSWRRRGGSARRGHDRRCGRGTGGVVSMAQLRGATGAYAVVSCTNENEPPYQVAVYMNFHLPQSNSVTYLRDI